jgi:CHAD domain-containing protein
MRTENLLLRNWQSEVALFRQSLSAYDGSNPEHVHQIRIHIKKLRAYLDLYLQISKKKDAKPLFKETENLFSLLGKHRDIEINKLKVPGFAADDDELAELYLAWLQSLQHQLNAVPETLSRYPLAGLEQLTMVIKKEIENEKNEKLVSKMAAITHHILKKVKKRLEHFRRQAHRVRKDLKNLYYWSKISITHTGLSKKSLQQLSKILDLLGNLQDEEVSLRFMQNFHNTVLNNQQSYTLKTAEDKIEEQKTALFKKSHRGIEKFLNLL